MVRTVLGHVGKPVTASTPIVLTGSQLVDSSGQPTSQMLSTIAITRPTPGTYIDTYGRLQTATANTIRYNNSTYVSTNYIRNPRAIGAVTATSSAAVGTGPTTWSGAVAGPPAKRIVGQGVLSNGMEYIDYQYKGPVVTPSTLLVQQYFEATLTVPASLGQTWCSSVYVQLISGTIPDNHTLVMGFTGTDGAGTNPEYRYTAPSLPTTMPSSTLTRMYKSYTIAAATTIFITPGLWVTTLGAAYTGDYEFVLRFAGPQLEQTVEPSALSRPPPGTQAVSSLYTGNRILSEETRSNGVRNPRAEGAISFTGVAPATAIATNWSNVVASTGLTLEVNPILASASPFNMTGLRAHYFGITSGAPITEVIEFEARNVIAAVAGQTWTGSFYYRLSSGSFTGLNISSRIITFDAAAAVVNNVQVIQTAPDYQLRRATQQLAATGTTAWIENGMYLSGFAATTAYDFTIDLFVPQLEVGAFASSVMLPTAGVPAASGRANDNISTVITPWFKSGVSITNKFLRSAVFDDAVWTKQFGATIVADAAVCPDNATTTADKFSNGVGQVSYVTQNISVTAGVTETFSIFAKADVRTSLILLAQAAMFTDALSRSATFNLSAGTTAGGSNGSTATISSVGSGWYRCILTFTPTNTISHSVQIRGDAVVGDGIEGIFIWGAQQETASTAGPYMATAAATVTKASSGAGTIVGKALMNGFSPGVSQGVFVLSDGTLPNRLMARGVGSASMAALNVTTSVSMLSSSLSGGLTANTAYKVALAWDASGVSACINGGTVTTDPDAVLAGATTLGIGQSGISTQTLQGEVESITYYPFRMTNAQLQLATT